MKRHTVNLLDPEVVRSPYALYRELRERDEPAWMPEHDEVLDEGKWLFSRYDDVKRLMQLNEGISKEIVKVREPGAASAFDTNMLSQDPPNHTRLRQAANKAFTPSRVASLSTYMDEVAAGLIASIRESEPEFDFIRSFAAPFPILIIARLLGVPGSQLATFRQWTRALSFGLDSGNTDKKILQLKRDTMGVMEEYFSKLIEERKRDPKDDLISEFVHMQDDEGRLSPREVLGMCILLLFAGNDTTVNLLGSGLYTLLNHPEEFQKLKNNQELLKSSVEEILRFESPAQRTTFRVTCRELCLGGVTIPEGQQVCGIIGAANRDPQQFDDPDRFNIERAPNKHLAFGLGIHSCLGSALARSEGYHGLKNICASLPDINLVSDQVEWNANTFIRGIAALPVSCRH